MNKIVDLFSGCGGMSIGFKNAGFDIVGAFEIWETAAICYENNLNHTVYRTDLSDIKLSVNQIRELCPDIIIGGPPCQDFSHAGKRIESERANLTETYAKIISEIKPSYFVMENVERIEKSIVYKKAKDIFKSVGYGLTEITLDASHCGIPQKRKRFFCIGALFQKDNFIKEKITNKISEKETTLKDYFGNILDFEYYYRHPRNYNRRAIFSIYEPAPTMRGVNRPIPKGYPGHPNDACEINPSIRALTTIERSLIQTFPPDYKWQGNKTDTEQMIGNAVPVKLAEFIADILKEYIEFNKFSLGLDTIQLTKWLISTMNYTSRSASDIISRLKRANRILQMPSMVDNYYIFRLENMPEFQQITTSVRSQIKKAIALYMIFYGQYLTIE